MGAPPAKCLRGTATVSSATASHLGTSTQVPLAVYLDNNFIGIQWAVAFQKTNGTWVVTSTNSTIPGVSAGQVYFGTDIDKAVQEINTMGLKSWILSKAQSWASLNIYGYFSQFSGGENNDPVTTVNFRDKVNAALDDMFVLVDTNADGLPEFHGK